MSGGHGSAHRINTTAATDDPLSASWTGRANTAQQPMGGQAGTGLSASTYAPNANNANHLRNGNGNNSRNRRAAAGEAAGGSPLARYGLVSHGDGARTSAAVSKAARNNSALYPPNLDDDGAEPNANSGSGGGGHHKSKSGSQHSHVPTHAVKTQHVTVGSDPLASAMETPLFQLLQQQQQQQQRPKPQPKHPQKSSAVTSGHAKFHGSSSLLDSSSLLQPAGSIAGGSSQQADLFKELSTPSPVAQSSQLDFDSPSPQMIPRSEVKLSRVEKLQPQTQPRSLQNDSNNNFGAKKQEAIANATAAVTTPAAAVATTSDDNSLFHSPSPVMIPRSEMKARSKDGGHGGSASAVHGGAEGGPLHYPTEHHHNQRLLMRQASTDPLGGGSGGGTGSGTGRVKKEPVALSPKRRDGEQSMAAPVGTNPPANESNAASEQVAEPAAPLHASNPALARALWASDDADEPGHHPLDVSKAGGGDIASINTNSHIPASGFARVERQRRSSLSEGGSKAATTTTGRESDGQLPRTARWRIRLGLLEVPHGNSRRQKASERSRSIRSSDGNLRRGSNESKRRDERPKRLASSASTGIVDEKTWKLNDLSSDEEADPRGIDARRGKMQRSNSLDRLLGLRGAERTDEAGSRRSSFNHTWTSSDFAKNEPSSPITSQRVKRRNSLSKLLGIADGTADERPASDNEVGTELHESQSSSMNLDYLSSEEEPDPPVDIRPVICVPYAGSLDDVAMSQLVAHNVDMLEKQRLRYDGLAKRHYWSCKEIKLGVSGENNSTTEAEDETKPNNDDGDATAASSEAVFDPLSALADEEELKQKREEEMDLQYRKEKARQHLGLPDNVGKAKRRDSACGGSRFTDYYSSAEVLHVIEKDLNRLPPDHVAKYHRRQMKKLGMDLPDDSISYANTSASSGLGENVESEDEATKLLRISRSERSKLLGEILFVYAREHQALGYRQGMHEILSYLLLAMEIDLETCEESIESSESDSTQLLEFEFLRNDLYTMFEAVMGRLSPAYDTHSTKRMPATHIKDPSLSPMEVMGESILTKVRDIAGDAILHRTVCQLGVPPQLFCTRWVRLIFAREVEGSQNVLDLWDAFFAIAAEEEVAKRAKESDDDSSDDDDDEEDIWLLASLAFMDTLEAAAASMILLVRERLLAGQRGGESSKAAAMNDALHTLMNPPPLKEATPLADLVRTLIWQQRREARAAAPPNRRGRDLSSGTASGSSDRPKRRNSLSKLFGLDSEVGIGIADQVRDSMTKISDAIGAATTPPAGAVQSDMNAGMASTPHPPPRRRSQSPGALPAPPPQAEPARSEEAFKGRSNEELATSLGTSVATIMQHLKNTSLKGNIAVPHNVWEALLDINDCGKDLVARDGEYT